MKLLRNLSAPLSQSVSVLSIESLGVKHLGHCSKGAILACFSTLYRVVGGETGASEALRKAIEGFSTLYRVVGGETYLTE